MSTATSLRVVTTSEPGASPDVIVGRNIRERREELELTQRELVERLGALGWAIDTPAITRIEKGTRALRVNQLTLIAQALETIPESFFEDAASVVSGLRAEVHRGLLKARRGLVEALSGAQQVWQMTRDREDGVNLLRESGLPLEPDAYLDWLSARVERYARASDTERVMVFESDDRAKLLAIAEAVLIDLFDLYVDVGDGVYVEASGQERDSPPDLALLG